MRGFSWDDYEDVIQSGQGSAEGGNTSADGDDDGGWGIVRNRKYSSSKDLSSSQALFSNTHFLYPETSGSNSSSATPRVSAAPETMTKKQRQNAAKRDMAKADKDAAEAQRLQLLNKHKRELERAKMDEQWKSTGKGTLSGGLQASVNEKGSLIWG